MRPKFLILFAVLAICLCYSKILWRLFEIAPLKFIAKYSYGIYLWHTLVFDWFARTIDWRYGWRVTEGANYFVQATLVCLVITIFVSMISWRVIERPFVEGRLSGLKRKKVETNA